MKFSERLIELRKSKGWSQEELGDRLDVTRQTVSKWELGQTTPEMDKLIELSRIFNTSIDVLTGNEEDRGRNVEFSGRPFRYEYKSKKQLFGLPLVHINTGFGMHRARGIIAIGTIASRTSIYWGVINGNNKLGCIIFRDTSTRLVGGWAYSLRCNFYWWYISRSHSDWVFSNRWRGNWCIFNRRPSARI